MATGIEHLDQIDLLIIARLKRRKMTLRQLTDLASAIDQETEERKIAKRLRRLIVLKKISGERILRGRTRPFRVQNPGMSGRASRGKYLPRIKEHPILPR